MHYVKTGSMQKLKIGLRKNKCDKAVPSVKEGHKYKCGKCLRLGNVGFHR